MVQQTIFRNKFTAWYSVDVQRQIESERRLEDIEVDLRLSVIKPVHAAWPVQMYIYLTSVEEIKLLLASLFLFVLCVILFVSYVSVRIL